MRKSKTLSYAKCEPCTALGRLTSFSELQLLQQKKPAVGLRSLTHALKQELMHKKIGYGHTKSVTVNPPYCKLPRQIETRIIPRFRL